ncbi:apiosidase-like domain-containing protein [Desertihabitans aurantiacus]|uniref:apiosidase-like domain-containing protein n=1 Tax=Desertihabitans aurantiacus TaxID=2282477 RepID=UPI000DF73151|nr:DUF4038 domain-containing protein [Desertihabitans aurantiacus]
MPAQQPTTAPQWQQVEITLTGPTADNPYTDVDLWVDFTHDSGDTLRRPAFFDGGTTWRVRFASTLPTGRWTWSAHGHPAVDGTIGELTAAPPDPRPHPATRHGFWRLSPTARTLEHADGTPVLVVADTAWALPWRATPEEVVDYARHRSAQGFNAAQLMSVQPDMRATGPRARGVDEGFDTGFDDLPEGRLTRLRVEYFRTLDELTGVLVDHGITPVLQPVFHGFGWKGLDVAGPVVPPEDYARYCRYLVARYGARPAVYLVGADGAGTEPQIEAGGKEVERQDCYGQPTGIHYRPHARNDAHQAAAWLDFQWCQTGHAGEHVPERLATMWAHRPVKAVMNGEPTYEHTGLRGRAAGWWQGHEAWQNLCAGGVMGVAYGAGSLWQWAVRPDEPGQSEFFLAPGAGWREALHFEGAGYVGLVGRILAGLPVARLQPCWDVSLNTRGLLDPGVLYIGYAEHGGPWRFLDADGRVPSRYWLLDPTNGAVVDAGLRPGDGGVIDAEGGAPRVLICSEVTPPSCA